MSLHLDASAWARSTGTGAGKSAGAYSKGIGMYDPWHCIVGNTVSSAHAAPPQMHHRIYPVAAFHGARILLIFCVSIVLH